MSIPAPLPSPTGRPVVRILGAWLVGAAAGMLALPAAAGALFGAWTIALTGAVVVIAGTTGLLAVLHRATGGGGRAVRWAALVTAGATLLATTSAAAWAIAGRDFGPPLLWQVAIGASFAVCAAAATRPTRLPAAVAVAALAAFALAQVVPPVLDRLPSNPSRGCIASSAAEAEANCPSSHGRRRGLR